MLQLQLLNIDTNHSIFEKECKTAVLFRIDNILLGIIVII